MARSNYEHTINVYIYVNINRVLASKLEGRGKTPSEWEEAISTESTPPTPFAMEKKNTRAKLSQATPFALMTDDLLLNILSRLPALSFASAACVSKSWNRLCNRVLSRPKLATALSLDPSPQVGVSVCFPRENVQVLRLCRCCWVVRKIWKVWFFMP